MHIFSQPFSSSVFLVCCPWPLVVHAPQSVFHEAVQAHGPAPFPSGHQAWALAGPDRPALWLFYLLVREEPQLVGQLLQEPREGFKRHPGCMPLADWVHELGASFLYTWPLSPVQLCPLPIRAQFWLTQPENHTTIFLWGCFFKTT